MSTETIPIAADHAGFELKQKLVAVMREMGLQVDDKGTTGPESTDYPAFAKAVAAEVSAGTASRGVLLCGSGVGMDIAANRFQRVRAALAWNSEIAALSRKHNNSNVLVLPARFVSDAEAEEILRTWLATGFEGGRHAARVSQIDLESEK